MSPANLEPISPSPPKPHHLLPLPAFPVPHEVPAGPLDAGTVAWSLACSRSRLVWVCGWVCMCVCVSACLDGGGGGWGGGGVVSLILTLGLSLDSFGMQ